MFAVQIHNFAVWIHNFICVNVFLSSSSLDGGDKYSAFRELEQPAESKYLGKHWGFIVFSLSFLAFLSELQNFTLCHSEIMVVLLL